VCVTLLRRLAVRHMWTRWGVCHLVVLLGHLVLVLHQRWMAAVCLMVWCCPVAVPALGLVQGAPVTLGLRCGRVWLLVQLPLPLHLLTCLLLRLVWHLVTAALCRLCLLLQLAWRRCVRRHTAMACTRKLMVW